MGATCDYCGARSDDPITPITWSVTMNHGRVMKYCEGCTRTNLRGMEGKLDAEYW